ncbi:hypothetical protein [Ramlibacter henchirensis]|nr:hypothetical protein [Ramlibacter henchirensis]
MKTSKPSSSKSPAPGPFQALLVGVVALVTVTTALVAAGGAA